MLCHLNRLSRINHGFAQQALVTACRGCSTSSSKISQISEGTLSKPQQEKFITPASESLKLRYHIAALPGTAFMSLLVASVSGPLFPFIAIEAIPDAHCEIASFISKQFEKEPPKPGKILEQ